MGCGDRDGPPAEAPPRQSSDIDDDGVVEMEDDEDTLSRPRLRTTVVGVLRTRSLLEYQCRAGVPAVDCVTAGGPPA
jgi:hypothetical protein